jgi:hypothetical protein
MEFRLQKWGLAKYPYYDKKARGLLSPTPPYYSDKSPETVL